MSHTPIHNHTEYSNMDGLATVDEIVNRCTAIGCESCGVTDHGTVSAHLEFADKLKAAGLKPILGCELYHGTKTKFGKNERDQSHFVVGALTDQGLRNLWRMVDASTRPENFRFVTRVNWDIIERNAHGLFATSSCIQGLVPQGILQDDYSALNRYLDIFGDNFYIELHTYPTEDQKNMNLQLVQIAQERGIPVIYANDAHYAFPQDYDDHDLYMKMKNLHHPPGLHIQDVDEIMKNLDYLPTQVVDEALRNSSALAAKCDADLPEVRRHLPAFIPRECPWLDDLDKDKDAKDLLTSLVIDGVWKRYGNGQVGSQIWNRIETEIETIFKAQIEHYFLQTWDFCRFCDEHSIARGPGRGSSAGSIVAYLLGITDVDPLKYGLIFERFYNAGREEGLPDIDNDFPRQARRTILEYLKKRWGEDKVYPIGTVTRLKPKAALEKSFNVCQVSFEELSAVKKMVDQVPDIDILGTDQIGWSRDADPGKEIYVWEHAGKRILDWINEQPQERQEYLWNWIAFVEKICSRVSGYGIHPSGVVISDSELAGELPCAYWSTDQELYATAFPMRDVEKRQFVKQDILGLRNLDTLQDWMAQIKDEGIDFEWSGLENEYHPPEMWALLHNGFTQGIFHIEDGQYARDLCKDLKPTSIEDLALILSLNRPGPKRSINRESFVRRHQGKEPVSFDHPSLQPILQSTYGWFIYQEQIIEFFRNLGYTLSEADAVRKILGKKQPEKLHALREGTGEWKGRGYNEMAASLGEVRHLIWSNLVEFAKYSFNKSHGVAYATITFRTLFAKFNAPAQFLAACIRTNRDEAGAYAREATRLGIQVMPPDILKSDVDVEVIDGKIHFGIANVKGVGRKSADYLLQLREEYAVSTPEELNQALDLAKEKWEDEKQGRSPRQQFRANQISVLVQAGAFDAYTPRDIDVADQQQMERELLGIILTDKSNKVYESNDEALAKCDSYEDIGEASRYTLPGAISTIKERKVRKTGAAMGIVTIEYESHEIEFAVFPRQWKAYNFLWKERTVGIFTLNKSDRGFNFEEGFQLSE